MRLDVSGVRGVCTVMKSLFAQMSSRSALSMPICKKNENNTHAHTRIYIHTYMAQDGEGGGVQRVRKKKKKTNKGKGNGKLISHMKIKGTNPC